MGEAGCADSHSLVHTRPNTNTLSWPVSHNFVVFSLSLTRVKSSSVCGRVRTLHNGHTTAMCATAYNIINTWQGTHYGGCIDAHTCCRLLELRLSLALLLFSLALVQATKVQRFNYAAVISSTDDSRRCKNYSKTSQNNIFKQKSLPFLLLRLRWEEGGGGGGWGLWSHGQRREQ